jgi:hypothetical protein
VSLKQVMRSALGGRSLFSSELSTRMLATKKINFQLKFDALGRFLGLTALKH